MQGIVIQGPTNYANEVAHLYEGIPNVVWSTWDGEDFSYIISKGIDVITTPLPSFAGRLNINYQTTSTHNGIEYLKNKGVTEILKIRGDLKPNNIRLLLEILKGKPLSFLAKCKPGIRPMYYELEYVHNSYDFPIDLLIYGSAENLGKCFNFQVNTDHPIPPEALITHRYFLNSNLEFKLDYRTFIDNGISFFMNECLENNIEIEWLKQKINIIESHSDPTIYDY